MVALVATAAAVQSAPIAGRTVQHRLKLTAAVASFVDIAPVWTLLRLLTMLPKFPIKTVPAFLPATESPVTFMRVAS